MAKKKIFTLAWLAILIMACSLTDGASLSAVQFKPALTETPTASPSPSPTPSISTSTPEPARCKVTADYLNLRACAGTDCRVLNVLKKDDLLTILERGHWLNVQLSDGRSGYINSNYCKIGE